jgi:2-polyprenyl-6-methoxyphenol hydroxylase-like FAD-dependent oxidoreductase
MASAVLERPSKAATKPDNSPEAPLARRAYNGFPSPPHILIAGAGPVGLFLSLLLARSSIRITVLESAPLIQPSAKAMTHMPAIFPFFKKAGVWEALVEAADGLVDGKICFRRTADKSILGESPEGTGRPGPLTVSQHIFCEILLGKLGEFRNVDVRMGVAVSSVYNGRDKETVYVVGTATETSREEKFEANYVVGADGGRSFVRAASEIKSDGETLLRDLVATDVYYPFDKYGWEGGNFMADPEHYGLIGPISTDGLWRVSFGVPVDTTTEEVQAMLPAKFEAMFPGPRPLDYKVKRLAVYKAQQVCAETMRKRRVLLVGDAAHRKPPCYMLDNRLTKH